MLNKIAEKIHKNAENHGWWDEPKRSNAEVIALCHSELSEALEADRKGAEMVYFDGDKPEGMAVEMIDCVIRIFDWCAENNVDIDDVLFEKMRYNQTRPYKHGKRY